MKETQLHSSDEVKIIAQKEIDKQLKHIGRQKVMPGHQCWEINHKTREVSLAKIERVHNFVGTRVVVSQKVTIQENCFYILALNSKNALKKYYKYFKIKE